MKTLLPFNDWAAFFEAAWHIKDVVIYYDESGMTAVLKYVQEICDG